jgi:hypothetical protein
MFVERSMMMMMMMVMTINKMIEGIVEYDEK